jgi:hypothetical protein
MSQNEMCHVSAHTDPQQVLLVRGRNPGVLPGDIAGRLLRRTGLFPCALERGRCEVEAEAERIAASDSRSSGVPSFTPPSNPIRRLSSKRGTCHRQAHLFPQPRRPTPSPVDEYGPPRGQNFRPCVAGPTRCHREALGFQRGDCSIGAAGSRKNAEHRLPALKAKPKVLEGTP